MWLLWIASSWANQEPVSSDDTSHSSGEVDTTSTSESTNDNNDGSTTSTDDSSNDNEQDALDDSVTTDTNETDQHYSGDLNDEEALQLLEELLSSSLETVDENQIGSTEDTDDEELGFEHYRGNFYYVYQLHRWSSPNKHTVHSGGVAGDPQYYFQHGNNWGSTLGMRFQLSGSETLDSTYQNNFLGLTIGVQYAALRFNTAASWVWEHYYVEEEVAKDVDFVTYRYDELPMMSGVLWEQTLSFVPAGQDFGLQLTFGLPFQVIGERDMGNGLGDAWIVSSKLNFSFLHIGYQYSQYPEQSIQMAEFGTGMLF